MIDEDAHHFSLGLSALVLGGAMVGCAADRGGLASAGTRDAAVAAKAAARDANRAARRWPSGRRRRRSTLAEAAVALTPQQRRLSRAARPEPICKAGRFASATHALRRCADARAGQRPRALNLALAADRARRLAGGARDARRPCGDRSPRAIAVSRSRWPAIPAGGVAAADRGRAPRRAPTPRPARISHSPRARRAAGRRRASVAARGHVARRGRRADRAMGRLRAAAGASDQVASLLGVRAGARIARPARSRSRCRCGAPCRSPCRRPSRDAGSRAAGRGRPMPTLGSSPSPSPSRPRSRRARRSRGRSARRRRAASAGRSQAAAR